FCFTRLDFGKPILWKDKKLFEVTSHEFGLKISFDVTEAATNFIKGLFMSQEFYVGDKFNGIEFRVAGVEALHEPHFKKIMYYRLQTPWVVSFKNETDKYPQYLDPEKNEFGQQAIKHLVEKLNNTRNEGRITNEQIRMVRKTDYKR